MFDISSHSKLKLTRKLKNKIVKVSEFSVPLFQNESKFEAFHMKMSSACSFIFMQIKGIFINGFALRLVLKQKHKETWKCLVRSDI